MRKQKKIQMVFLPKVTETRLNEIYEQIRIVFSKELDYTKKSECKKVEA